MFSGAPTLRVPDTLQDVFFIEKGYRTTSPGGASRMLGLVEDARDAGLDVTFDSYPYNLSSTRLTIRLPQWTHDGGYARLMEVLRDQKLRTRPRSGMGRRADAGRAMG